MSAFLQERLGWILLGVIVVLVVIIRLLPEQR